MSGNAHDLGFRPADPWLQAAAGGPGPDRWTRSRRRVDKDARSARSNRHSAHQRDGIQDAYSSADSLHHMRMPGQRIAVAIAGAQKAGTTSLLRYMSQHPQLSGHIPVECAYFADEVEWRNGWEMAYVRYFYGATTELLLAKSASLYTESVFIERLASHNPDCTVVLILRDPVERAFSAYRMEVNEGWIDQPFDHVLTVLEDETHLWNRLFIEFGNYPAALRRIYEFFPASQVKVLIYEEFIGNAVEACRDVFRRVGVDDSFSPDTTVAHNVHRELASQAAGSALAWLRRSDNPLKQLAKRALPPQAFDRIGQALIEANQGAQKDHDDMTVEIRNALGQFYRSKNRELERLLDVDLSHWSGMSV